MQKIESLKKLYGDRTVLDIENLVINKGETLVLIGPNGSGKSTLLKILASVIKPTFGEFHSEGKVLYMPQGCVAFNMSVMKNLMYSTEKPDEKRWEEEMEQLKLSHLKNKNAKGLSGGERQRLAFGRIIVNECELLLLDEPTSAVDVEGAAIIEKALEEYKKQTGCTVIMSTHSPSQARRLADRIIMLNEGRIEESGSAETVLTTPLSEWGRKFIDSWKI